MQRALVGSLRYLASRRKNEKFEPSSIQSVLSVELSRLGDVVVTLPTLLRLQSIFPSAEFLVLVDKRYVSLLNSFDVDWKVIGMETGEFVRDLLPGVNQIRKKSVDLAISLSPPRKNALITLGSNARFLLGYLAYVDSLTPFLLENRIESFGFELPHEASYGLENIYGRPARICEALGMIGSNDLTFPGLKQSFYETASEQMKQKGVLPDNPYIVLHPFSSWQYRNWNLGRYIELASRVINEIGWSVVVSCKERDSRILKEASLHDRRIKVVATSDPGELAVLVKGASLIVGNDSGPLHLATALGVNAVGLFGPAPPEITSPPVGAHRYLYKKFECSPCDQRRCIRPEHSCMMDIEIDDVLSAIVDALCVTPVEERVRNDG